MDARSLARSNKNVQGESDEATHDQKQAQSYAKALDERHAWLAAPFGDGGNAIVHNGVIWKQVRS